MFFWDLVHQETYQTESVWSLFNWKFQIHTYKIRVATFWTHIFTIKIEFKTQQTKYLFDLINQATNISLFLFYMPFYYFFKVLIYFCQWDIYTSNCCWKVYTICNKISYLHFVLVLYLNTSVKLCHYQINVIFLI